MHKQKYIQSPKQLPTCIYAFVYTYACVVYLCKPCIKLIAAASTATFTAQQQQVGRKYKKVKSKKKN